METTVAAQDLIDEFAFFDDWEDRYRHVIELGRALAPLTEDQMVEANRISGCASRVWLVADADEAGRLKLQGGSDAHIVQGLVAILIRLYDGLSAGDAQALEVEKILASLDLTEHLTAQRANGLGSMVARIRAEAAQLAQAAG